MKNFPVLTLLVAAAACAVLEVPKTASENPFSQPESAALSQASGDPVDLHSLVKKDAKEIRGAFERMLFSDDQPESKHDKIVALNELLRKEILANMSSPPDAKKKERRLDDSNTITRAKVAIGNDDISTSNRLNEIKNQEKAMQDYGRVGFWLDDVNFKLNDLRSNVQRRIQDMSVGLQRRSLLLGHYNFMGEGIGAPTGKGMTEMNPYFHF